MRCILEVVLIGLHHEVDLGGTEEEGGIEDDSQFLALAASNWHNSFTVMKVEKEEEKINNIGLDICLS